MRQARRLLYKNSQTRRVGTRVSTFCVAMRCDDCGSWPVGSGKALTMTRVGEALDSEFVSKGFCLITCGKHSFKGLQSWSRHSNHFELF